VVGLGWAAYTAVMAVFVFEENRAEKNQSATTLVAATLTFALGAYAVLGEMHAAAAMAVVTTIILAMREPIHGWVDRLTWPELRSGLVLLAMTFIALPVVPSDPIGPYGGVNPREVWLIAIALAGVSFLGYAAVKYFGAQRGMLIAGLAGGVASSTAVTVANARRAAAGEGTPVLLAAGVALASSVMFLRVVAIVLAMNTALLPLVAPPLLVATVVAVVFALASVYGGRGDPNNKREIHFKNPFSFWSVVGFALFLGLVIVAGRAIGELFGAKGAVVGAALAGLVDVDAITVSIARLVPDTLTASHAAVAILVAVMTDTISKIAIGAAIGHGRFALAISAMAFLCIAAGALAAWATFGLRG
jgi:uncharacterized membrane protein (DUF4010 family)